MHKIINSVKNLKQKTIKKPAENHKREAKFTFFYNQLKPDEDHQWRKKKKKRAKSQDLYAIGRL